MLRRADQGRAIAKRSVPGWLVWRVAGLAVALAVCPGVCASFDEFGQLSGPLVFELLGRTDARSHTAITLRDLEALPAVLRGERAALVLVQTDQGNLAKVIVSAGFRRRKPSEQTSELIAVLVLERFETIVQATAGRSRRGARRSCSSTGFNSTSTPGKSFPMEWAATFCSRPTRRTVPSWPRSAGIDFSPSKNHFPRLRRRPASRRAAGPFNLEILRAGTC